MTKIVSRAPGRVCLFGDHQDYLGLPIIACAIDRYMEITAVPNHTDKLELKLHNLDSDITIDINDPLHDVDMEDFYRLSMRVAARNGCTYYKGYDISIDSTIPINAGVSSSTALVIAWLRFLFEAYGNGTNPTPKELALYAYEVEVVERGSSGGKMDQFSISLGDAIFLNTITNKVTPIDLQLESMVVGSSGIPKDTSGTLRNLKSAALSVISKVKDTYPNFNHHKVDLDRIEDYLDVLSDEDQPILEAALLNHDITQKAKAELTAEKTDVKTIGHLMNAHHRQLKENLGITVPKIDDMISAAIHAGAYGAKIVGSGGGGCIVALCSDQDREAVIQAIKDCGAADVFAVKPAEGAFIVSS